MALVKEIAANGQHKLISTEAELEATRRLLEEEKERYNRIQSEASEKIAQAMENTRRATERLSATELELEASRKTLDEERERCKGIQSQAFEKLEEALSAEITSLKERADERKARACEEASLREAAAKARDEVAEVVRKSILSTQKLSAAETGLEATCLALAEEREHCQRIQAEISEKQMEMLLAQKIMMQELEGERQVRALAEASLREAAARAQEEQNEALLAQLTTFLKLLSAQVDTAEKALHWDTK